MTASQRKIIHIDMDAFFASVEQRDHEEYRNKPVIVGGLPNSRGVVAACSYEARQFGIHSAMPSAQAYRLCPQAIFVRPRFEAYREVSAVLRAIFWRYASEVEPLSLDEAYLDVSYTSEYEGSATRIAQAIKQDILDETGLIASAGVSYNKFLAKVASDQDKPNGLFVITPEDGERFVAQLAIRDFYGIGPATERKMLKLGIKSGKDLRKWSEADLVNTFGKSGYYYFSIARAIDHRPVRSTRMRKSYGKETTFESNIQDRKSLLVHLEQLCQRVLAELKVKHLRAKRLTVKVKYANFKQVTRCCTLDVGIDDLAQAKPILVMLLDRTEAGTLPVRLVGVSASGLQSIETEQDTQLDLSI